MSPRRILGAAAALCLFFVAFGRALHDGDVDYDTPWLVFENPILRTGSLSAIPLILRDMSLGTRNVLGAEYLPVRDLTVLLDFALFGDNYVWHHAVSLLWYALGCLGFLAVASRLLPRPGAAWLAAALYTLHPVHVESVAWLASRKDVVSLAFFFAACWVGVVRREAGGRWVSAGLLLLAMWAKNTAIVLPAVLVAWDLLVRREPVDARWLARWAPWALVVATGLAISTRLGQVVGIFAERRWEGPVELLALQGQIHLHYLASMVWPPGLSASYPDPVLDLGAPRVWVGIGVFLGLVSAVPLLARRNAPAALGVAWWILTLLPVSHLLPLQNYVADRYLLIPSAGLVLALVSLWPAQVPTGVTRGVAVAAAVLLSLLSWGRSAVWLDSASLWADAVEKNPSAANIAFLAGAVEREDRARAEAILRDGLTRFPEAGALWAGLGVQLMARGETAEAEDALRRALPAMPDARKPLNNLLVLLNRQGRFEEALPLAGQMVERYTLYPQGWNTAGVTLLGLGRLEQARYTFERSVELNPYYATARCNLARTCQEQGDEGCAAEHAGACGAPRP